MGSRGVSSETGVVVADSQTAACTDLFVCGICDFATSLIHPFLNHFKVHNFSISLDKDTHTCSSQDGASVDKQEDYKCYLCSCLFTTICRLHDHLMKCMTVCNGSYIFDNNKKTAFPFHGLSDYPDHQPDDSFDLDESILPKSVHDSYLEAIDRVIKMEGDSESANGDDVVVKVEHESPETVKTKVKRKKKRKVSTAIHECGICQKIFPTSNRLKLHSMVHSDQRPFSCDDCDKTFKLQSQLNEHRKCHKNMGFKCDFCDKMLSSLNKKINHERSHSNERQFACDQCDRAYKYPTLLKQHKKIHLDSVPTCEVCGKLFQSVRNLREHETSHTNIRPFPCDECGRSFKLKNALVAHKSTHLAVMPFVCDVCAKGFGTSSRLKMHMMRHSEESRKFPCEICDARFYTRNQRNRHMHVHTGIKTCQCDLCGMGFARPEFLKVHMQGVHNQDRRFECTECEMKFLTNYQLKCHAMTHSGERPHRCKYCDAKFIQRKELKKHTKRIHGLDLDDQTKDAGMALSRENFMDASMTLIQEHNVPYYPPPEKMTNFPAPEKMTNYQSPEKMTNYPPTEKMTNYAPDKMTNYAPPEKMTNYQPSEKMMSYPPPEKMTNYPPPSDKMSNYSFIH